MSNHIKDAFNTIHAEEELKNSTKSFVFEKTNGYSKVKKKRFVSLYNFALTCVSLLFLVFGGNWLYFTPTALISVDVNPSLELGVNRLDRIISVKGLNEDGIALSEKVDLLNKNCTEAINELLNNETIVSLEKRDEVVTITVTGKNDKQSETLLSEIETVTHGHENTDCHSLTVNEADEAHALGLSCGKYREYLILKQYDPSITPEDISGMTMKEIRNRINSYEGTASPAVEQSCHNEEHAESGHHGQGHMGGHE